MHFVFLRKKTNRTVNVARELKRKKVMKNCSVALEEKLSTALFNLKR